MSQSSASKQARQPIEVNVVDARGGSVAKVSLPEPFLSDVNDWVLFDEVLAQRARRRRGTADTKTRREVAGSGKKPWKQKGTGRARAGSVRSPIWRGGGIVFGPHPRSYAYRLPKQARRTALCSALSQRAQEGEVKVVEALRMGAPKTKELREMLRTLGIDGSVLIVSVERDSNVELSARNLPGVQVLPVIGLNVEDVLRHKSLLVTRDALAAIEERLAR